MGLSGAFGLPASSAFVAILAVTGCSKSGNSTDTAALMAHNPAAVCASKDTLDGLRGAILNNLGLPTDPASKTYQSQLQSGANVALNFSVLNKFEKDIKKISCSGKITISWPSSIINRMNTPNASVDWATTSATINYEIQPAANGDGYVYRIDAPGAANIVGSAQTMVALLVQADAEAAAATEAAQAAAQESANAANEAAREALAVGAASDAAVASGATPTSGSTPYQCAPSPALSSASPPTPGAMAVMIDETRSCVNNRTAYYRVGNGGLVRIMLVDANRRVSVVSISPDRTSLLRQDFILPKAQYALARSRGIDLISVACPATDDPADIYAVQSRLSAAQQSIATVMASLAPTRRMSWSCAAKTQ